MIGGFRHAARALSNTEDQHSTFLSRQVFPLQRDALVLVALDFPVLLWTSWSSTFVPMYVANVKSGERS